MSGLANQSIEIFRAGNYPGKGQGVYTREDLDAIVSSYNPAVHEAPATLGHKPASGDPAGAWVKSLRREGDVLVAVFDEVDPDFEAAVKAGKFKNRSAGFAKMPGSGKPYLHHVAFLGAQAPHIKGLKPITFSDDQADVTEIDFEESTMADTQNDGITKAVGEWFAKHFTLKPAAEPTVAATFSEEQLQTKVTEVLTAALADKKSPLGKVIATFEESQQRLATAATETRAASAVNRLKQKGKWVPAFERMGLPVIFQELAKTEEVVTFGEGTGKQEKTPLDVAVAFFEELPKLVPTAPVYTGQPVEGAPVKPAGVNDTGRAPASQNSIQLDQAVRAHMAEHKVADYGAALSAVSQAKPELTKPDGPVAGAV